MEIKIEDLEKGDLVIIGNAGGIRAVKLLRPMKLAKKPNWRGDTVYGKVLCSFKETITDVPYTRTYNDYQGNPVTYSGTFRQKNYGLDEKDHNQQKYVDFNYRNIYLIKKGEEL